MSTLTQQRVRELLEYDAARDVFLWRANRGRARRGAEAGQTKQQGGKPYKAYSIDGELYGHRALCTLYGCAPLQAKDFTATDGDTLPAQHLRSRGAALYIAYERAVANRTRLQQSLRESDAEIERIRADLQNIRKSITAFQDN